MLSLWAVAAGYLLDLILGDPHWMPHPVRLIGWGINRCEGWFRILFSNTVWGQRAAGGLTVFVVAAFSVGVPYAILRGCGWVHPLLQLAAESVMCYQILATKSLRVESMAVYRALKEGDMAAARQKVSMIVGRDTHCLDAEGITKAAVETVAENTSDGVVAPLFFLVIGGAPLGFLYKAVNTLDSMIGYRNERYRYFGTAAAKLDDLINFIPARLAALCMIIVAFLTGMNGRGAWRIFRRDRFMHKSPNSAQTESVCAGALGVQLGGTAFYFGAPVHKPTIGDPLRPAEPADIKRANRLLYGTSLLSFILFIGARLLLQLWLQGGIVWIC